MNGGSTLRRESVWMRAKACAPITVALVSLCITSAPLAAQDAASATAANEERPGDSRKQTRAQFSLHIGVNAPPEGSELPTLHFADDDAWRMQTFFAQTSEHSEWLTVVDASTRRRDAARRLAPPPPTQREVGRALGRLRQRMAAATARGQAVDFVVTFAGHGVLANGTVQLALLDGFLSQAFFDDLATWPEVARLHLVLDACHAGGVFTGRGFRSEGFADVVPRSTRPRTSLQQPSWFARRPHVGALLSSSASGVSHEWTQIEGGLFTHEVLSALRGAADVDDDGTVTYDEVAAFSTLAKSTLADPSVAGAMLAYPPAQDPLVALSHLERRLEGTLRVPPQRRIWVRHVDGRSVMHVHTGATNAATLHLPTEVPLVAVDEDDRQADFVTTVDGSVDLLALDFKRTTSQRGEEEGPQKGWLKRPFTQDFLAGWTQSPSPSTERHSAPVTPARPSSSQPVAAESETDFPVLGVGALAGVAVGGGLLAVGATFWMATSAAAYNQTDIEVEAATAAGDYTLAATGMVLMGATSVAAATAGVVWAWSALDR